MEQHGLQFTNNGDLIIGWLLWYIIPYFYHLRTVDHSARRRMIIAK